jgi:hypothetical protein
LLQAVSGACTTAKGPIPTSLLPVLGLLGLFDLLRRILLFLLGSVSPRHQPTSSNTRAVFPPRSRPFSHDQLLSWRFRPCSEACLGSLSCSRAIRLGRAGLLMTERKEDCGNEQKGASEVEARHNCSSAVTRLYLRCSCVHAPLCNALACPMQCATHGRRVCRSDPLLHFCGDSTRSIIDPHARKPLITTMSFAIPLVCDACIQASPLAVTRYSCGLDNHSTGKPLTPPITSLRPFSGPARCETERWRFFR